MNISKRQTLVQLGVTSFSFLSGCCCLKSPVDPNLSSVVEPKINPWLSPLGIVRASTAPSLCIDTHAHFFNASDINVRGYFAESIGHSLPPQLRKLVELIAPFVQLLAEIAPLAKDEYQEIVQRGKTVPFQTKAAFEIELQNITNQRRDMIAQHIYDTLKASQVPVEYEKLKQQAIALRGGVSTAAAVAFSLENVRRALDRTATRQNRLFSTAEFQVAAIDPDGIFEFIGHMLGNRWMSLRSYRDVYSTSTGAFGIDAVFGSLIDFDYWLDCFPGSAREDQMRLQSLLSLASGGYMLPLISYNPWTDMKTVALRSLWFERQCRTMALSA